MTVGRLQQGFRIGDGERSRRYLSERAVAELVRLGYPPSPLRPAPEFRGLLPYAAYSKVNGGA
jgi:hypothetical protein